MMGDLLIYPKRLFDLKVEEVRTIIGNTFEFTFDILKDNLPELIAEIKDKANVETISDTTIKQAVEEVEKQIKPMYRWFDNRMRDEKWKYTKDRASKNYFKVLNEPEALKFVYRNATEQGKGTVICMPLYHAIAEMSVAIFDYSLSKSDEMKRKLKKSDDRDRQKIQQIKSKLSLKYIFVNVLKEYGATERQIIRNMSSVFGTNANKAIASANKLPKLFR